MLWKIKLLILIGSVSVSTCGTRSNPTSNPTATLLQQVDARVAQVLQWAPVCSKVPGLSYPAKQPNGLSYDCGDGDSTSINGLICLSGASPAACEAVRRAIGPDGRMWRSPYRVGLDPGPDTASRDQLDGFLSYLVRTKDKITAQKWWTYMEANGKKLCPVATDNRCDLVPTSYGQLARVWRFLGLTPTLEMTLGEAGLETTFLAEAEFTSPGYQLADVVDAILRFQKMGENTDDLQRAADVAYAAQPDNPFFAYVSTGATDEVATLLLQQAAPTAPVVKDAYSTATDSPGVDSMGWEYVALAAFLEGK